MAFVTRYVRLPLLLCLAQLLLTDTSYASETPFAGNMDIVVVENNTGGLPISEVLETKVENMASNRAGWEKVVKRPRRSLAALAEAEMEARATEARALEALLAAEEAPLEEGAAPAVAAAETLADAVGARVLVWVGCESWASAPHLARIARHRWFAAPPHRMAVEAGGAGTAVWADLRCGGGRAAMVSAAAARNALGIATYWLLGTRRPPPHSLPAVRLDTRMLWVQVPAGRAWAVWAATHPSGRGGVLEKELVAEWEGRGATGERTALTWRHPLPPGCRTFKGQVVRGGIVLLRTPLSELAQRLEDGRQPGTDSISKHNTQLFLDLQGPLNFTLQLIESNSWGYPSADGWDGVMGMLERREVELGVACFRLLGNRRETVDFTGPSWAFRSFIMFRHPASGGVGGALFLPLSRGAWAAAGAAAVVLLLALRLLSGCERKFTREGTQEAREGGSWADDALAVAAVLSLQGAEEPSEASGARRLLLLAAAALAVLLDSWYAAGVVTSLLLPPPPSIRSKADLTASHLQVGAERAPYTTDYFLRAADSEGRELWRRKLSVGGPGRTPNFLPAPEGVERVRTQAFAYHAEDGTLFPLVARTFTQRQRCALGFLPLFTHSTTLYHSVQKRSPLREVTTAALRRAWAAGIIARLNTRWHPRLQRCGESSADSADDDAEPVEVQALGPAFLLVVTGMAVAIVALLAERRCKRLPRTCAIGSPPPPTTGQRFTRLRRQLGLVAGGANCFFRPRKR